MSAPKIIDNIDSKPVQVSPDYSGIFDRPNKPNYIDIGVSSTTSLPKNKEYLQGYAVQRLTPEGLDVAKYQYQAQSVGDAFKNGLMQFGSEAILGTLKSAATLLDLPQYVNIAMNKEKEFNTVFGSYIDEISEGIRERNPVFGTEEVELGNPKFWASLLPDLGTTVSLFLPTGAAVKGLSLAAKGIMGANKAGGLAGKVANHILNNKDTYKGVGAAMISRTMESSLEAEGTLKESYQKYLSEGYGDEQAKQMAGEDARNTYVANLPLVLLDAVQYTSLYKGMFNPLRGARAAERALANTTSNAILKAARGVYKTGKALSGVAMESGEELLQFGIQKEASKADSATSTLLDAISNLPNYVSDPEAQKAMISGAFGGGVFEGLSYAQRKLFKKDAEIDNDLEAGRVAGAHYKSMKTFMDIIDEDRLKLEKLTNEGRAEQHISKADNFLEAAKYDTDSFTSEDIGNLTKLKDDYYTKLKDYTNKGFSGNMLNKIVEEDMKATIFSNLEEKLKVTKPNSPQLTDKELRFKALSLLEEMESGNTNLMKSSKLKSKEIIREVRKEKELLLAEMQVEPDFELASLNRKIKSDSKYREALTVQSNIETAKIFANIANANLEKYKNIDTLTDDIEIDKVIENYDNLIDYREKFTSFDDYLNYLDKLNNEGDDDLSLVVNTIYDDLIQESLKNKEEVNPKLLAKIKDENKDLFELNKANLTTNPDSDYYSVISTPINKKESNIFLTGKKDVATGLVLTDIKTGKRAIVLSRKNNTVKVLEYDSNKKPIIKETTVQAINNTTILGTYRTSKIDNTDYIVTQSSLIDVNTGEIKDNFSNIEDALKFRRATLDIFSTSTIFKIEENRKKELQNSDLIIKDAEKLYPVGELVFASTDDIVTKHKKTLGFNPSNFKEGEVYTLKFPKDGKVVDRIFKYYKDLGLVKQIKNNGTLIDDPNYERVNDTTRYGAYQLLEYPDKSVYDTKNVSLINKKYDKQYVDEVEKGNISIESALELLNKFNSNPHKAVIKALESKIDLKENYDFQNELNNALVDDISDVKSVNELLLERDVLDEDSLEFLKENINDDVLETINELIDKNNYDTILIPEGKALRLTLNDGTNLNLTSESRIIFLRDKKTNKIELSVIGISDTPTDDDLIMLSVAQAYVENVLKIPVYNAGVMTTPNNEFKYNKVSLLSIFTYDNTKMPYNSGYDYLNSNYEPLSDDDIVEELKTKYTVLENYINDLISEGETTVADLINHITAGLNNISSNTDSSIVELRNKFSNYINNLNYDNVKPLIVRDKKDIEKAKRIELDFVTELNRKDKYKGKLIYGTPGSGKTSLKSEDIIDADDLIIAEMNIRHPDYVKADSQTDQEFILNYVNKYDNKEDINKIVFSKIEELKQQGKTIFTGTKYFLEQGLVDFAFSISNKYTSGRLKNNAENFTKIELELGAIPITNLQNEIFTNQTKRAKLKSDAIVKNNYASLNGMVYEYTNSEVLIGEKEVKATIENNYVTVNGTIPKSNNIVKVKNNYTEINASQYVPLKALPLRLNDKYKDTVIYMDEATMDLFYKGDKEFVTEEDIEVLRNNLKDIKVLLYNDLLEENKESTDDVVKSKLKEGYTIIKELKTTSLDITNYNDKNVIFEVTPKTLLDYTLDKYNVSNNADAKQYVEQVNNFTKAYPLSTIINSYDDLIDEIFTLQPSTPINQTFSKLIKLLNNKQANYIQKFEKYTLDPLDYNIKLEPTDESGEIDTYIQSNLFEVTSLTEGKAYPTKAETVIPSEKAKMWINAFNQIKGTSHTIDTLKELYKNIEFNTPVKHLYVNNNTVIPYVTINKELVPIGLLDTVEEVNIKHVRYGILTPPSYLNNLWKSIEEQSLELGSDVQSDKVFLINDIHYTGKHSPIIGTKIESLRGKPKFDKISIFRVRKGKYDLMYGEDISSNNIVNYNSIKQDSGDTSSYYFPVKVSKNRYKLIEIELDSFKNSDNFLEDFVNNERYKKEEYIKNNFFYFGNIIKKIKELETSKDFKSDLLKFLKSSLNSVQNITTDKQLFWANINYINNIKLNIGIEGFLNTNFIITSKDKPSVITDKKDRKAPPIRRRKTSKAKGIVVRKLSRESALNNLKRILPEGYDVRFYENLIKDGNDYLWGYVSQRVIGLSDQGRIGEEYHEAFHVVFNAFINETERERLLGHVKNYYKSTNTNSYTDEQLNDVDFAEELLADLYRDFALAYDEQDINSITSWIKNIPNAIIRFFKRLFNLERTINRDKQKLDNFFKSISVGKFNNRNAELVKTFKPSKADTIFKNGTEKFQVVKLLSSLAIQQNVYDLSIPSTVINDTFLNPEKSVLTNLNDKYSLINSFVSNLNDKLKDETIKLDDNKIDIIERIVKGLRLDVEATITDNVITLNKIESYPAKFGEIPSHLVASFASYGYSISDVDLDSASEINYDNENKNDLVTSQMDEDDLDIGEEEVNQVENYNIKNYINPPHLKLRGLAKSALSLVYKNQTDMFGLDFVFNYEPQEAANKFLLAFGDSATPQILKTRIEERYERELKKSVEYQDDFYVSLKEVLSNDSYFNQDKIYNILWDTLGKLSKATFFNTIVNADGNVSRTMANLDDLQHKIKSKLYNILSIKELYDEDNISLPNNANLLLQFGKTFDELELPESNSFDDFSDTNKKAVVALMNYFGYNDSFEYEDFKTIYSLSIDSLKDLLTLSRSVYESLDKSAVNKLIFTNSLKLTNIIKQLPSNISNTHKTIEGKLYYEWQVPNAVNRIIKSINNKDTILDPLYRDLPLLPRDTPLTYEESNGFINKQTDINLDVSKYSAKELLTEIIVNAQEGSFITPVLSDSGRQVYIGGIKLISDNDIVINSLVKLTLIENNRKLTKGGDTFKNYDKNSNLLFTFPTLDTKVLPTTITDFTGFDANNYPELKVEIEKIINVKTEEFFKALKDNEISLNGNLIKNVNYTNAVNIINTSDKVKLIEESQKEIAKNLYLNHLLNHVQLTYILVGDPAYYKNYEDLVKRSKQIISPSSIANIYNYADIELSNFNYYDTSSRITVNDKMKISIKEDIVRKSINDEQLKVLGLDKPYKNNNLTDAQSYIDDIAYRNRLISESAWTQEHQDYMDISMNGYPASKLTLQNNKGKDVMDIKKQSPVEVIKPFYYSLINYIKNGRNFLVPFQKKDSEFKISPYYGLKTINGINNIMYNAFYEKILVEEFGYTIQQEVVLNGEVITKHKIGFNPKNRNADIVSFESAIKVFTERDFVQDATKPFEKGKTMNVPFEFWGRQVETPKGHFNKDNNFGTQIRKLILSRVVGNNITITRKDGTKQTPVELLKDYNDLLISDIERGEKRFLNSLKSNGKIDGNKIIKLLKSEFLSRKKPLQYIEALELLNTNADYDNLLTKVPISHPFHTLQIQTILNSLHRNKVSKLKFKNGFKLANASSIGFKRQPQIVFNNPKNPKEGIKHFEIYAPIHDSRLYKYVDAESGLISEAMMSQIEKDYPGILDGVVYRIPTEEKYSIYKTKIIGFVVDEVGAIFMPDVATTRSGLDFDIDKMFGFFKDSTETTIDGKEYIGLTPEQYAKKSKYKINTVEFNNDYNDYQEQLISDNAKIDMMMDVLSSEHTVISQMKPGGFEEMEFHALELDYIKQLGKGYTNNLGEKESYKYEEFKTKLKEFKNLTKSQQQNIVKSSKEFWDVTNISDTINRMNIGKQVLGIAANFNAMSALIENSEFLIEKPVSIVKKIGEKKVYHNITYNGYRLLDKPTRLRDINGNLKYENTSMLVAASADNGKSPTLEPLGINPDSSNYYVALMGYGFPRRIIEKLLVINTMLPSNIEEPDIIDSNITEDKLERIIFNPNDKNLKSILYTVKVLLSSNTYKKGAKMSKLLKYLKIGDNGLASSFLENMINKLEFNQYISELYKNNAFGYLSIVTNSKLFNNISTQKMFDGLGIISDIVKIPEQFAYILDEYGINKDYHNDFYNFFYTYVVRKEYNEFKSPQTISNEKLKLEKVDSILNVINHLNDFKNAYPDNIFLQQLEFSDSNKVKFTEQRKKDDSLIGTTMTDFENLLNSDEQLTLIDKYTNKEITINTAKFANDLAYYTIQAYGFTYNYESFSYIIPPSYYDNHRNFVTTIDNTIKSYVNNNEDINTIVSEYLLNNPIAKNFIFSYDNSAINIKTKVKNQASSLVYQPLHPKKIGYENGFMVNDSSIIQLPKEELGVSQLVYRTNDNDYLVKIFETNTTAYYLIAKSNSSDNIDYKTLRTKLTKIVNVHYPESSDSYKNKLIDYGLHSQEFSFKLNQSSNIEYVKYVKPEVIEVDIMEDAIELGSLINTNTLSLNDVLNNTVEVNSEVINLLKNIASNNNISMEDVINSDITPNESLLNNYTEITYNAKTSTITINEYTSLSKDSQQSLSEVIPMLKKVLDDYNKNKQVEVETPTQQIYSQLGNKTQSENVILPEDLGLKFDGSHKSNMWTVLSPNFKKQYPNGIIAYRGKVDSSAIGNPFSVTTRGEDTVKQFIEWIITGNNFGVETILMGGKNYKLSDLRNEYINIIKKAKGEKILYYNELGRPSHATALDYLINKYDWNKQSEVNIPQDKTVTYTPIGKTQQTYTIVGGKIFNKDGVEVFKEDSRDRNKIFANLAIKEKRAVIVTWKDNKYVVNNNNKIISVKTGDMMKWGPENGDYKGVIAEANKLFKSQQPESQTINVEPKGKKVADGIYVNQESLTKEEQLELFDYLKPFLESQGKKTNKGANAPIMIGLNLRWDYKSNNPNLTPVNVGNNLAGRNTSYAYYNLSINGKPLGEITQRFIELMNKSTGIDISNYDGAIINLYTNESFIGNHSDLEESATAEKYPVVVANIGGSGNIILGTDKNQIKVDLKSGASYLFGFKGKNRKIPHSTYASDVKGFLPSITISQEGKTFNTGSYRVSITMRRVMPLELGMPSEPIIISDINQQPTDTNDYTTGSGFNKECKTRE